MIKRLEAVLLGSEDAEKLATFYRDVVGLKQSEVFESEETGEKGYAFDFSDGPGLYINDHSDVHGKNEKPARIILNLEVDDIEKESHILDEKKVKKQQDIYHVEGYGLIATYVDPDGNYFQLVQVRPLN